MGDKTVMNAPPPPPSEVKIRTMRSDIDSMIQAGGSATPSFHSVSVAGLSLDKERRGSAPTAPEEPMPTPGVIQRPPAESAFPASGAPPEQPSTGGEAPDIGPESSFWPKIIVSVVALVALVVVGYVAYITFVK